MNSISLRAMRGLLLREIITLLLFAGLMLQSVTAVAPDWWTTRGALMPDADSDDFAVANVGQLKNIAEKAAQEMNDSLTGGAGTAINAIVNSWAAVPAAGVVRDDYAALTLGQLKTVAKPYYDRLAAVGLRAANTYPWTGTTPDDYALANLGQVKTVFAFAVPPMVQLASQTGIPSAQLLAAVQAWQTVPMDQRAENATLEDLDGDGISNLQEYLMGKPLFDPTDIDGDRIPNTVEDLYPGIMSKSRFADAVEDYDGDGVMNYEEIQLSLSLSAASSGRSDGLNDAQVLATHLKQTLPGTVREMEQRVLWDSSISSLTDYDYDDGLLTGHPEWQSQADANANGLPDGWEAYIAAYVPSVTRTFYVDCDGDHMPDIWEYRYLLDLRDSGDAGYDLFGPVDVPQAPVTPNPTGYSVEDYAAAIVQYQNDLISYAQQRASMLQMDPDLDRLCNLREYYLGSNPRLADTNGDATDDGAAVLAGQDPSEGDAIGSGAEQPDDDGDGIPNAQEIKLGIDPSQSNLGQDQDGDGFTDVEEALAGSDIFDPGSRCGPAILERTKSYGYIASTSTSTDSITGEHHAGQYFGGDATNDYGGEFIHISESGDGELDLAGMADSVRSAFESGSFDGPNAPVYPKIVFGYNDPRAAFSRTFTNEIYQPSYVAKAGAGAAKEFSITAPTIPNAPAVPWTRIFLVTKYTGVAFDVAYESQLADGTVVGIIAFSQDKEGNQSVTYQGSDTDVIKVAEDNKSVVVMPPQVESQIISYRLTPVEAELIDPKDETWQNVMQESRAVLDDESIRLKITFRGLFENDPSKLQDSALKYLYLKTSATKPALSVQLQTFGPSTTIVSNPKGIEVRVKINHSSLKTMELLPEDDDDGVDEESAHDFVLNDSSNLEDSKTFLFRAGWQNRYRGYAATEEEKSLFSNPPQTLPSKSFVLAAGSECLTISFFGTILSVKSWVMNQSDVFYFSGHGHTGYPGVNSTFAPCTLECSMLSPNATSGDSGFAKPTDLAKYWSRDLNCAVIAGCAMLNVNNWVYNNSAYSPPIGIPVNWPGMQMENVGPRFLLGYGSKAPSDSQGSKFVALDFSQQIDNGGDYFDAWRIANQVFKSTLNAVAIEKGVRYGYFKRVVRLGVIPAGVWTEVPRSAW